MHAPGFVTPAKLPLPPPSVLVRMHGSATRCSMMSLEASRYAAEVGSAVAEEGSRQSAFGKRRDGTRIYMHGKPPDPDSEAKAGTGAGAGSAITAPSTASIRLVANP